MRNEDRAPCWTSRVLGHPSPGTEAAKPCWPSPGAGDGQEYWEGDCPPLDFLFGSSLNHCNVLDLKNIMCVPVMHRYWKVIFKSKTQGRATREPRLPFIPPCSYDSQVIRGPERFCTLPGRPADSDRSRTGCCLQTPCPSRIHLPGLSHAWSPAYLRAHWHRESKSCWGPALPTSSPTKH